jgi:Fic family protein
MQKYLLLIYICAVVFVNFYPSKATAQSCNTPLRLLEQSDCDTNWDNYKEGYQDCVMNAAKWFWKEYACSWESVEKLNKSCEGCAKTYKKTK